MEHTFSLSPIMKALSVIFAGMMFSGGALAAQCAANGGTIATDEKGNCTITDASSTLNIDANYNAWVQYKGANGTLNVGQNGTLLTDATSGYALLSAIVVKAPAGGSWTLNNKGKIKTIGYADVVDAESGGKYIIDNAGTIENVDDIDKQTNFFTSRGINKVDVDLKNSGTLKTSGSVFYLYSAYDNSVKVTNEKTGLIKSTDFSIIETSGIAGQSNVELINDGTIEAKRSIVVQPTTGTSNTFSVVNRGTITSGGGGGNAFDTDVGGKVNFENSGKITSTKQDYLLYTKSKSDINVNNTGTITMDGVFVDARSMDKASTLSIKNGQGASAISTASNGTAEYVYSLGYLDIDNSGTLKSDKAKWLLSSHGGAHIVNNASGLIESGGSTTLVWQSSEGIAKTDAHYISDITNKGTMKATGNGYGIFNYAGAFKFDNSGKLLTNNRAVYIENSGMSQTITNTGTIDSTDADATVYADGKNVITNGGTISNGRKDAYAIYTGAYDDSLILLPGSNIKGIAQLGGGNNTLTLGGDTGKGSFDISQVGNKEQYRGINNTTLTKDGKSTWTINGASAEDQTWKAVNVKAGTLAFGDNVTFNNNDKAYDFTIADGATTEMGASAYLKVKGKMTIDGTLNVTTGQRPADKAAVVTDSAAMGSKSALNVSGFSVPANASDASKAYTRTLIMTSDDSFGSKSEPFADVQVGGVSVSTGHADYISAVTHGATGKNYYLGTGLSWFAGACANADAACNGVIKPEDALGSFTLEKSTDVFNVDLVLNDQAQNGSKWDGKTLTKDGQGQLILSQANTYTGATNVLHGSLDMGIADAIKTSSSVTLANKDATLNLNDFSQTLNNLSGVGNVTLGTATLTNNLTKDSEVSGIISGAGNVVVTGSALFTLSNDNTYTGTTTVSGGILQLGNGGSTGSVTSDITDNGTVIFNRNSELTYNNVISGTGNVTKLNSNNMLLNKDQTFTGTTDIQAGSLILNRMSLASSAVTVGNGAMLAGYGSIAGNVTNNGTVAIADAAPSMTGFDDSVTGDLTVKGSFINNGTVVMESPTPASTLTVKGDYIGNNGTLAIDTILGDDTSATDKLVVEGNTSGNTNVIVTNAGGQGAPTQEGIQIVNVKGDSNGTFALKDRVIVGKYDYNLFKGSVSNPEDGDWYLRRADSENAQINAVSPEFSSYLGNQTSSVQMFQHELHDRVGSYPLMDDKKSDDGLVPAFWARMVTHSATNSSADGINNETDTTVFQMGNDIAQWSSNGNNSYHLGWMLGYGHSETDSSNPRPYTETARDAHGESDGYSVGAYGTWYQNAKTNTGLYVDSSLQYTWYNNKVESSTGTEKYDSDAWLISAETGYTFPLNQNQMNQWFIEPQDQLTYNSYNADDRTVEGGTLIHDSDADGLTTRLGTRLSGRLMNFYELQPSVEVNWLRGTAPNSMVLTSGGVDSKIYDAMPKDRYEMKAGVQAEVYKDLRVYMNAGYQVGGNGYDDWSGLVGARYNW